MPSNPNRKKWMQLGPCLDWWLLGLGLGMIRKFWKRAFSKLKFSVVQARTDDMPELRQDFNYHDLQGRRFKYLDEVIGNELNSEKLTIVLAILAVVFEPLRWLGKWWSSFVVSPFVSKSSLLYLFCLNEICLICFVLPKFQAITNIQTTTRSNRVCFLHTNNNSKQSCLFSYHNYGG